MRIKSPTSDIKSRLSLFQMQLGDKRNFVTHKSPLGDKTRGRMGRTRFGLWRHISLPLALLTQENVTLFTRHTEARQIKT